MLRLSVVNKEVDLALDVMERPKGEDHVSLQF